MNLQEYQSKRIFAKFGVPIPRGEVATTATAARDIARRLGTRVVIKSQVLVGGRGKAGGIKLANTPDEAEAVAERILGMDIKGLKVRKVLVDEAADIRKELYLGLVIDRAQRRVVMMGSSEGGVDIEEVAAHTPEKITKIAIDPFLGLKDYQAREMAMTMGVNRELVSDFIRIAQALYTAFVQSDASLAEINPLAIVGEGKLVGLDGKMAVDDNALFRHPDLDEMRDVDEEDPYEAEARRFGLSYVKLDGEIGCMVNGAGLAMATMDIIKFYGGSPANFLDVGGGAQADKVAAALRIILSDKNVKAVLFNIFGGITRCDEVARGILTALKEVPTTVPMVARLVGTNEAEGRAILADAHMGTAATLDEAADKAVRAARGELKF
ncbi:MAG: ADP-forming succinate--CoA ligase subunit beta [Anaerolineae bacterium]|uniref:ADP-forming succinate--CoA ligase subunit beta n=1 Tax=Candidatus Amarolinea dominans TaxID=3140696 RepID=UPI0031368110|nr:ADP-forming succinate--CoA ligase subunit beta [Anaerolineae bacterium]